MSYTALARRYRSRDFSEVVGQEAIARTLEAAISADRVAHAYLFCGTRGVGKTTMARVFAKALCGGTEAADEAIMTGQDTDVIEIDGASNNSVDDARDLISNAAYRPMRAAYKIYIIDEVHMLSTSAFNALLKTMEEPPEHVKFILCTTEAQKVPATIQSRCQRFDFKNIPTRTIADRIQSVIADESLEAEPELVHAIARQGNGSMRDALSILDRVMASGENNLTLALLEELLGLPEREHVSALIDACAGGDPARTLAAGEALLGKGAAPDQVLESLVVRLRDLMILCACGPGTELLDLAEDTRAEEAERSKAFDAAGLMHMIALCESVQRSVKSSPTARALFDALLVRLAMSENLADIQTLIRQIESGTHAGKA